MNIHIFVRRQLTIQAGVLKNDSKPLPRFVLLNGWIEAIHFDPAAGWLEQRGKHLDSSGFSGAIGSQESEDFAPSHFERDAVYSGEGAKCFDQVLYFDHI